MKITMTLPKILLNIIEVIHKKLEIAPEKEKTILIDVKDFKDEKGVVIPKLDLEKGLKKLAETEIIRIINISDLYRYPEDYTGDRIELEPNRERVRKFYEKHCLPSAKMEFGKKEDEKVETIKKFPYRMPAGTKWENITIQFLDNESALISVKGRKHKTNYKEMGFEDKRSGKPDSQWLLLKIFAKYNGELSWKTTEANEKVKKTKELLAKTLQNYFKIDYDPFHPYHSSGLEKAKKSYKIKILLIPPLKAETQGKIPEEENLDKEIDKIYKEQTPEVYNGQ